MCVFEQDEKVDENQEVAILQEVDFLFREVEELKERYSQQKGVGSRKLFTIRQLHQCVTQLRVALQLSALDNRREVTVLQKNIQDLQNKISALKTAPSELSQRVEDEVAAKWERFSFFLTSFF